ncbi:MAG TPA: sulfotransferase, partial [Gemmatimonadales bacterium]|nr:sulfotransferase [Gemmatimonadales bacterium]
MPSRPPVFIVGSPRSGTTWLYHLLLSSGDFAIYRTESRVFDVIGPRFGGLRRRSDRALFLSKWLAGELFYRSGLDADDLTANVLEFCRSAGDLQRILM